MAEVFHALGLHMHQPPGNLVALHNSGRPERDRSPVAAHEAQNRRREFPTVVSMAKPCGRGPSAVRNSLRKAAPNPSLPLPLSAITPQLSARRPPCSSDRAVQNDRIAGAIAPPDHTEGAATGRSPALGDRNVLPTWRAECDERVKPEMGTVERRADEGW
jgi:hypothetical protein